MQFIKLICIYLSAIIICSLLFTISLSPILIFFILFTYVFCLTVLPYYNTILWSKNIKKIDRFLLNNRRQLLFHYSYSVAHESKEEQRIILNDMIRSASHPNDIHVFRAQLAVLDGDYYAALNEAKKIKNEELRYYTAASSFVSLERYEDAFNAIKKIKTAWMIDAIHAHIAYNKCSFDEYKYFSISAINKARGIHRYTLNHTLYKPVYQ